MGRLNRGQIEETEIEVGEAWKVRFAEPSQERRSYRERAHLSPGDLQAED